MSSILSVDEAHRCEVAPGLRRLLTPEEVARLDVVPLAASDTQLTVAAGPGALSGIDVMLRMRLGFRTVVARTASRAAMQALVDAHYQPFWVEKGWIFPGFSPARAEPRGPGAASSQDNRRTVETGPAEPAPDTHPSDARPAASKEHTVVLLVEPPSARRKALEHLLLESGYEARFASDLADVDRELRRSPPGVLLAVRNGPLNAEVLTDAIRNSKSPTFLRMLRDYGQSLVEDDGDERLPAFIFDLVRFFTGIIGVAGGASPHRAEARARAAEVAARRMGLPRREIEAARLAALFVDLESYLQRIWSAAHNGDQLGESNVLAELLDPLVTPYPIRAALEGRRERFDGLGPRALAGEQISPAARVLAAVDAFFDLQESGAGGEDIEQRLRADAAARLDPRAVEAVLRAERAERFVDRLGSDCERIILVDPDPVAASLLEMRLANAGIEVEVHRNGETAMAAAERRRPDLVISEIAVPGLDGFSLLLRLRKAEATREVPMIFVTQRTDRAATVKGYELGADDVIPKPADLELLSAKVKAIVKKSRARRSAQPSYAGRISGTLSDLGLVDLLQVLAVSRRTVQVRLEDSAGAPGCLTLEKGRLIDARAGNLAGEEALYALLSLSEGRFTVHTEPFSAEQTIHAPLEALLLEACRRRDESDRDQ